jgi:hypothetical protein
VVPESGFAAGSALVFFDGSVCELAPEELVLLPASALLLLKCGLSLLEVWIAGRFLEGLSAAVLLLLDAAGGL